MRAGGMTMRLRPSMNSSRSGRPRRQSPFLGAALAERKQPRQPAPGGAIARIGQNVRRAVGKDEPRADRDLKSASSSFSSGLPSAPSLPHARAPHRPRCCGRRCRGRQAERAGLLHQFFRLRGAAQEREITGHRQFGIAATTFETITLHANNPCRYHCRFVGLAGRTVLRDKARRACLRRLSTRK